MRNWLERRRKREEKRKTELLRELQNVTNVGSRKDCMENVPLTFTEFKIYLGSGPKKKKRHSVLCLKVRQQRV